jgi:ketosteroid isomerase-like protein/predicted enzyme related to lactoylglutathione lyase
MSFESESDQPPILRASATATRLPAQDLERARAWYRDRLGLEPAETREGGLLYHVGDGSFGLFASTGKPSGDHTQMGFEVADIRATVDELKRRGVVFEEHGIPGLPMVDSVVGIPDNYASKGRAERGAWFRDSEGNLLGLGQPIDPPARVDPVAVVRALFAAWQTGDREALEAVLADDFRFWSPRDDGLDRAQYFATCWPHHGELTGQELVHVRALDSNVVVATYEAGTVDGGRFRNTELITVRDGLVVEVEVFFGRGV